MKCNWLRWLWGIIPVAILSWAAVQAERPRIEQELTEAATAQMLQSGAGWAQVTLQGRDAVLSGKAWEEADTEAAVDALRKQRGIRVVDNKAALVEKAETYVWSASRRNQRIRLSGFVPTAAMRRDILGVAKASFPGFDIVDRMALARGVPAADIWLGGISFGLTQLAGMRRGEVRLDNLTLSIVGEAEDQGALRAIRQAANNPPRGIKINLNQLAAPAISPYTWSAQVADGKFDLAGYFPDETLQAELVAAAKSVARGGAVTDRMQGGSGAPADWSRATQAAVRALARLESGAAELRDATLLVSGVSADEAAAEAVRALLRADLPASIKLTEQIRLREPPKASVEEPPRPPEPAKPLAKAEGPAETPAKAETLAKAETPAKVEEPAKVEAPKPEAPGKIEVPTKAETPVQPEPKVEAPSAPKVAEPEPPRVETKAEVVARGCQTTLTEVIRSGHILFESASAELDNASSTTLAKVAAAIKSCPDVMVQIEGHTDDEGTQRNNQTLSLQRARSVLDYLVKAGVNAEQLEPVGYGKTRPIAPSKTDESRAKNRRIEFVVRPK
ncbi:MAG: OmpA family protein [Hyphomicrobiaceae bacterium]|jgi:outer membrane protein OmpA-like peptidoglycan-associated protein